MQPLQKETTQFPVAELFRKFTLEIALGKYSSLWGYNHLKELAEAGGLSLQKW